MAKRHRKQAVWRKRAIHDIDTAKTWAIGISRALNIKIYEMYFLVGKLKCVPTCNDIQRHDRRVAPGE